jgi:hypothetical protein
VEFYDVLDEETPERVHAITLDTPSAFSEKVALEGDTVLIRAINDRDGNGACSAGEAWAEVRAPIKDDDTIDPVTLELGAQACPAQ